MVDSISLLDSLQDVDEMETFGSKSLAFEFEKVKISKTFNFPESPESPPPSKKARLSGLEETGKMLALEPPAIAQVAFRGFSADPENEVVVRDPMRIDTDSESDSDSERSPLKKRLKQDRI